MQKGLEDGVSLGPALGVYHPHIVSDASRLCKIGCMDEVSFHMSGTEAVMQAVRLARYHTGRTILFVSVEPITGGGRIFSQGLAIHNHHMKHIL